MSSSASTSKLAPPPKKEVTDQPTADPAALDDLFDEGELERILSSEASLLTREQEVRLSLSLSRWGQAATHPWLYCTLLQVLRVIKAFKLNPYEILDLNWMPSQKPTESEIRQSLQTHYSSSSRVADKYTGHREMLPQEIAPHSPRQAQA